MSERSAQFTFDPHPWYGPCDAFGERGNCSECARVILWLRDELYQRRAASPAGPEEGER